MSKLTWLTGFHAVEARLKRHPDTVAKLYVAQTRGDARMERLLVLAAKQAVEPQGLARERLDQMLPGGRHQGVAAQVMPLPSVQSAVGIVEGLDKPLVLALDGVTDPHNLGACLRSAAAFGVHAVVLPKDRSAPVTDVVARAASGALEAVPVVYVVNLAREIDALKEHGIWAYGAASEAPATLTQTDLSGPALIVMGAEGGGLRQLTRERCDALFRIAMPGDMESLNVSVATGIVLHHAATHRTRT